MSDVKVNGKYLPKGIYLEKTPVAIDNWHTYLVYRDGKGGARVLRGGPNFSSFTHLGKLKIDANIDIAKSEDAYKNGETPKNRHEIRLPINDEDLDKM